MKQTEDRREAIVRAAGTLLLKHGLRGTSMEAIARAADIAKPTLYAYFADKSAVFVAVADRLIAGWQQDFLSALNGEGDIVARVGAALTARHKGALLLIRGSPHAAELTDGPQFRAHDAQLQAALETALGIAGAARPRLLSQLLLAASSGVGRAAASPSELGPALRLLSERLIGPELV